MMLMKRGAMKIAITGQVTNRIRYTIVLSNFIVLDEKQN